MIVKQAEFLISAVKEEQWPANELDEIILCGRSNVGKSSFINAMVNRKSLAYTGQKPGMTRLLNFYEINKTFRFVDAPGYGYQQKEVSSYQAFDQIISTYLEKRKNLRLCLILLDIRRIPNEDDMSMITYCRYHHLPILFILTKADKLSRSQQIKQRKEISEVLEVPAEDLLLISAEKKTGLEDVWTQIEKYIQIKA